MNEPGITLPETLQRLEELLTEKQLNRESVLDVTKLARQAVLRDAEVQALLAGLSLADDGSPDEVVKRRVRERLPRVYQTYLETERVSFADGIRTIAARLEISEMWARQLVKGAKVPSVGHLSALARFFKIDERYFTGTPADNLNRALQPLLNSLESGDPVAELMSEYGLAGLSFRGLAPERRAMLAGMIKAVMEQEK